MPFADAAFDDAVDVRFEPSSKVLEPWATVDAALSPMSASSPL